MDFSTILLARKKKSKMNRLERNSRSFPPLHISLVSSPGEGRKLEGLVIESSNFKSKISDFDAKLTIILAWILWKRIQIRIQIVRSGIWCNCNQLWSDTNIAKKLKFIYCEKATKFCKISTNYLSYVLPIK